VRHLAPRGASELQVDSNVSRHYKTSTTRAVEFAVSFTYPVVFTRGVFDRDNDVFANLFPQCQRPHRLLVVVDRGLAEAQPRLLEAIEAYVKGHGALLELAGPILVVAGGEQAKNDPNVLARVQQQLAEYHVDRHSYCVAIGGGALLDVVGFAAATVHRGVRLIRLPSTVLGQNDAGVGVKNGVNAFGQKNFLGAFAPPFAVVNDSALLESLPPRELRAGMAEAVKVALIRDRDFFEWLCAQAERIAAFDEEALALLVERGAQLHLDHIEGGGDPFERGSARPLDFGHWSAHKLERLTNHELRHGEAVAIGIALDCLYSAARGWLSQADAERVLRLLCTLGLPIDHPALHWTYSDGRWLIEEGFEEFREHLGGELSITFLEGIGRGVTHHAVDLLTMRRCAERLQGAQKLEGALKLKSAETQPLVSEPTELQQSSLPPFDGASASRVGSDLESP
jgi:3-dehydroquinate synthase